MFKLTELPKEEEEHTEPMVESALIFLPNAMLKCGQLKKFKMLKKKEKPNKLLKEKFQLEKNDQII